MTPRSTTGAMAGSTTTGSMMGSMTTSSMTGAASISDSATTSMSMENAENVADISPVNTSMEAANSTPVSSFPDDFNYSSKSMYTNNSGYSSNTGSMTAPANSSSDISGYNNMPQSSPQPALTFPMPTITPILIPTHTISASAMITTP